MIAHWPLVSARNNVFWAELVEHPYASNNIILRKNLVFKIKTENSVFRIGTFCIVLSFVFYPFEAMRSIQTDLLMHFLTSRMHLLQHRDLSTKRTVTM